MGLPPKRAEHAKPNLAQCFLESNSLRSEKNTPATKSRCIPLSEALLFEGLRTAAAGVLGKKSADFYPYPQKAMPSGLLWHINKLLLKRMAPPNTKYAKEKPFYRTVFLDREDHIFRTRRVHRACSTKRVEPAQKPLVRRKDALVDHHDGNKCCFHCFLRWRRKSSISFAIEGRGVAVSAPFGDMTYLL